MNKQRHPCSNLRCPNYAVPGFGSCQFHLDEFLDNWPQPGDGKSLKQRREEDEIKTNSK